MKKTLTRAAVVAVIAAGAFALTGCSGTPTNCVGAPATTSQLTVAPAVFSSGGFRAPSFRAPSFRAPAAPRMQRLSPSRPSTGGTTIHNHYYGGSGVGGGSSWFFLGWLMGDASNNGQGGCR